MSITSYSGEYFWLSNFWMCDVYLDNVRCRSVEHGFQGAKFLDDTIRSFILSLPHPGDAKRAARRYKPHIRKDWYTGASVGVMRNLLWQKFEIDYLKTNLANTYPHELIEGNTHGDAFWGQCPLGNGENNLGKLQMEIRYQQMCGKTAYDIYKELTNDPPR